MMDSFRYCVLRYGVPARVYVDGGKVYVSSTALSAKISFATSATDGPRRCAYCSSPSWLRFRYCSNSGGACSERRLTCRRRGVGMCGDLLEVEKDAHHL